MTLLTTRAFRRSRTAILTAGLIAAVVACGDDTPPAPDTAPLTSSTRAVPSTTEGASGASAPATAATTEASGAPATVAAATTITPATTAPAPPAADATGVRDFVVEGVPVRVVTDLEQLPDSATAIRGSGLIIDDGDGPRMCMLYVEESYPPGCDGPIVDGLQMRDWVEIDRGVSFGLRTVDVSWPPVDNHVTLLAEHAFETPVVPEPVVAEPGPFSLAEVEMAAEAIFGAMVRGDLYIGGAARDDTDRRVLVEVVAADAWTVRALAELVDDPSILVVIGFDEILEGS